MKLSSKRAASFMTWSVSCFDQSLQARLRTYSSSVYLKTWAKRACVRGVAERRGCDEGGRGGRGGGKDLSILVEARGHIIVHVCSLFLPVPAAEDGDVTWRSCPRPSSWCCFGLPLIKECQRDDHNTPKAAHGSLPNGEKRPQRAHVGGTSLSWRCIAAISTLDMIRTAKNETYVGGREGKRMCA